MKLVNTCLLHMTCMVHDQVGPYASMINHKMFIALGGSHTMAKMMATATVISCHNGVPALVKNSVIL